MKVSGGQSCAEESFSLVASFVGQVDGSDEDKAGITESFRFATRDGTAVGVTDGAEEVGYADCVKVGIVDGVAVGYVDGIVVGVVIG